MLRHAIKAYGQDIGGIICAQMIRVAIHDHTCTIIDIFDDVSHICTNRRGCPSIKGCHCTIANYEIVLDIRKDIFRAILDNIAFTICVLRGARYLRVYWKVHMFRIDMNMPGMISFS